MHEKRFTDAHTLVFRTSVFIKSRTRAAEAAEKRHECNHVALIEKTKRLVLKSITIYERLIYIKYKREHQLFCVVAFVTIDCKVLFFANG